MQAYPIYSDASSSGNLAHDDVLEPPRLEDKLHLLDVADTRVKLPDGQTSIMKYLTFLGKRSSPETALAGPRPRIPQ